MINKKFGLVVVNQDYPNHCRIAEAMVSQRRAD